MMTKSKGTLPEELWSLQLCWQLTFQSRRFFEIKTKKQERKY